MSQRQNFNSGCFGSILILWLHPLDFRNPMQLFTNNRLYAKILEDWLKEIHTVFLILNSLIAFRYLKKWEPNLGQQSRYCPEVDRSEIFSHKNRIKKEKGFLTATSSVGLSVLHPVLKPVQIWSLKYFLYYNLISASLSFVREHVNCQGNIVRYSKTNLFFTRYGITANLRTVPG